MKRIMLAAAVALPLLAVIGFGILVTSVSVNMILQTIVDDDKRGRVMSLYTAAFLGIMPFGSLAAGPIADALGGHYFNRVPVLPDMIVNAAAGRDQSHKPLQVSTA